MNKTLENQVSKLGKQLNKKSKNDYSIRKTLSREEQKSGSSVIKYKNREKETKFQSGLTSMLCVVKYNLSRKVPSSLGLP